MSRSVRTYRQNAGEIEVFKAYALVGVGAAGLFFVDAVITPLPWWVWGLGFVGAGLVIYNGLYASGNY